METRTTDLNALNAEVQKRFAEIRARVLNQKAQPLMGNIIENLVSNERIPSMTEIVGRTNIDELKQTRENTDRILDFIALMNLPNSLSLAVGYIFAFNETNDNSYLIKALTEISKEVETVDGRENYKEADIKRD